jgi:RNase H-fold protein (predicted Holliday junction resolvase)
MTGTSAAATDFLVRIEYRTRTRICFWSKLFNADDAKSTIASGRSHARRRGWRIDRMSAFAPL